MHIFKDAYIKSRTLPLSLSPQDVICGSNEVWRSRWTIHRWLRGWESQQACLTITHLSLTPGTPPLPTSHMWTQRSWVARQEVASATVTSLWRLYLCCSAWDLARATYININKACCWGLPVRGCHRRGQRRDASALTSRLISLSVRPVKKVGISAQSGIAFGSLSLLHDYWTPSSILRLLFSSSSATFPEGGNPWRFHTTTHRIWVSFPFGDKSSLEWFVCLHKLQIKFICNHFLSISTK